MQINYFGELEKRFLSLLKCFRIINFIKNIFPDALLAENSKNNIKVAHREVSREIFEFSSTSGLKSNGTLFPGFISQSGRVVEGPILEPRPGGP